MNIIDGLQKRTIKILEKLITTIGWLFMLGYIFQILLSIVLWLFNLSNFYHKLFILDNIQTTIHILLITVAIAMCIFILIYFWGKYNYKRYAHLNRRKFSKNVNNDEIELYFGLPSSLVEKMQNDKIIILEKTIV
ncbi:hypothetical protein CPJCM30710_05480 [Clostridium polyendosporum]|uniref:Poly-beta-1,6-N-acetyl-D-glucosamine biosynthesis protein PgaD n=1 Tax=Clostridium polyendosporum TaxID=69208 RepID=A0A919RWR5_9CLOT|nr:poly-beta-1,6-N-acetyl-D-glucosamine biosynthesis protein PgaD [Clostridium polyendosporum]GIM27882.1 hypothetical protein CPJCM30710_05480 [Clostridium polyendosporum]